MLLMVELRVTEETYKMLKKVIVDLYFNDEVTSADENEAIKYLIEFYIRNNKKNEKAD